VADKKQTAKYGRTDDGKRASGRREPSLRDNDKIRVDGEIKRRQNKYYSKLAERFRIAGFAFFLMFVLFCGVMMVRYSEYITYDNFVYLIRDFDSMDRTGTDLVSEITFEMDPSAATCSFRGGFVVATRDSVTVYDSTGVVLLSEKESYSYPALAVSEKYIIAYDIGGTGYSVYNAVTRIASRKTEFPIVSASVCDSGAFALTTESDEAKYVTEVYNSALLNTMSIFKDKYVVSSAISADGEWICIASLAESGADFACETSFYKVGDSEASATYLYSMAMPLKCTGLDNGCFVVVCDDSVRFYNNSGELIKENQITGNGISSFDAEPWGVVLACREGSLGTKNRVYACDAKGNIIYDMILEDRVNSVVLASADDTATAYLVSGDEVLTLFGQKTVRENFGADVDRLLLTDSGVFAYVSEKALLVGKNNDE